MNNQKVNAIRSKVTKAYLSVMTIISGLSFGAAQVCAAGAAPAGVETDSLSKLVEVVFWVVRIAILGVGGIPSVLKIVQGQADENPRDRNAGIAGIVITGACVGATFAVKGMMV